MCSSSLRVHIRTHTNGPFHRLQISAFTRLTEMFERGMNPSPSPYCNLYASRPFYPELTNMNRLMKHYIARCGTAGNMSIGRELVNISVLPAMSGRLDRLLRH